MFDLLALFNKVNQAHFDGFLDPPVLRWNSRLKTSAGRFFPGRRVSLFRREPEPPIIEIASYLKGEERALELIEDTLAHEMIHYWLWMRRKPYGHTPEFHSKMRAMGVSRYNTVPKRRPYKHLYQCPSCLKTFPTRRKLGVLACADCCKKFSNGKFDRRFVLNPLSH